MTIAIENQMNEFRARILVNIYSPKIAIEVILCRWLLCTFNALNAKYKLILYFFGDCGVYLPIVSIQSMIDIISYWQQICSVNWKKQDSYKWQPIFLIYLFSKVHSSTGTHSIGRSYVYVWPIRFWLVQLLTKHSVHSQIRFCIFKSKADIKWYMNSKVAQQRKEIRTFGLCAEQKLHGEEKRTCVSFFFVFCSIRLFSQQESENVSKPQC